jgi:hypothetical protein
MNDGNDSLRTDLEIIRSALDSLFTSTLILDVKVSKEIILALGKIINEVISENEEKMNLDSKTLIKA